MDYISRLCSVSTIIYSYPETENQKLSTIFI